LFLLVPLSTALAEDNSSPGVLPPNSHPFGHTYGEWSARWWQWAYSLPVDNHPIIDPTGEKCGTAQTGPVWFLGGSFAGGTINRTGCVIPAGKALFFPILNLECDNFPPQPVMSVSKLQAQCAFYMNTVMRVSAEIDGVSVKGLNLPPNPYSSPYRVFSPVFAVQLPDNNVPQQIFGYNTPKGSYSPLVGDGIYLMLRPLSVGKHTIHFHAGIPLFGGDQDVTYTLMVKPQGHFD
jgi:hypothetical protein